MWREAQARRSTARMIIESATTGPKNYDQETGLCWGDAQFKVLLTTEESALSFPVVSWALIEK